MEKIQAKKRIGRHDLILETGELAKQADGAVCVQYGGTVVLVTCVMSNTPVEKYDKGVPLTVEYQEKTYAAGKIPGGFFKREGRPSEKEILTARLIDRPIRPLFPKGFMNEVQIIALVLSSDGENDPDILSMIGASSALVISNIPFEGPLGAIRIGRINNEFIVNPTYEELNKSSLDLVISANTNGIVMVEAGSLQLDEEVVLDALRFGYNQLLDVIEVQNELRSKCAKQKQAVELKSTDKQLRDQIYELTIDRVKEINRITNKDMRVEAFDLLCKDISSKLIVSSTNGLCEEDIRAILTEIEEEEVRKLILNEGKRVDGRKFNEIRDITCKIGVLPRTHGSGLFTRGQTQSLSVTTLGTSSDEQMIDDLEGESFKNFMLHYSFPPFSVGEVKPVRGPGRREIGHGALAERALRPVMPAKDKFPYTVRVVSEILESNGSSSMATVCAATLSLMDAGVPILAPVSGIAMGLIKSDTNYAILTDIAGVEDHFGDMDFKIAGTCNGITALQMDIKIKGVEIDLLKKALYQAKEARLFVLDKILGVISKPRENISEYAPRIVTITVNPDKIRDIIGPGGKTIKKIIEDTGATIDIEDNGKVMVASSDEKAVKKAVDLIKSLTEDIEVGKLYLGKITRIMNFGAFCQILPGKEGLIHISELSDKFVKNVEGEVKIGEEVLVKVIEIDEQGRVNLSRKQAKENQEKKLEI